MPGASGASLLARASRAGKPPTKAAAAAGVGVFVGASYAEWALLQQEHRLAPGAYTASGSGLSVLAGAVLQAWLSLLTCMPGANAGSFRCLLCTPLYSQLVIFVCLCLSSTGRVSYVFGWTGPATVTDTACSSSLVALSSVHQSLQVGSGRCFMLSLLGPLCCPTWLHCIAAQLETRPWIAWPAQTLTPLASHPAAAGCEPQRAGGRPQSDDAPRHHRDVQCGRWVL